MKVAASVQRHGIAVPLCTTLVSTLMPALALADPGLLLTGYSANWYGNLPAGADGGVSSKVLCGADGPAALRTANQSVMGRIGERLGSGFVIRGNSESDDAAIRTELCKDSAAFTLDPNAITYSACRFTMDQNSILMDMRVPTADEAGAMDVVNFQDAEIMRIPLYKAGPADQAAEVAEWEAAINWTGPGDMRTIAGHPATRWGMEYSTNLGIGGGMGLSINMKTVGHGYFSREVPGFELLEEFYTNFSQGISFEQGGGSFFGGLMNTWVEVLERGVPLEMDQTVTSSMGGFGAMGGGTRSLMKVSSLQLVDLPSDFCTRALTPDHFKVTDAGQGLSGMTVGPGDSSSGADTQSGTSPLGGLMDMLNSAGQQGSATAGQTQAPAARPAASSRSGPTSAELTTSNTTQSVQLHLQALGYEVGKTNGELDTSTIIAISQFQAEKGMKVTGEVTPQLLGVLGAAVDAQH